MAQNKLCISFSQMYPSPDPIIPTFLKVTDQIHNTQRPSKRSICQRVTPWIIFERLTFLILLRLKAIRLRTRHIRDQRILRPTHFLCNRRSVIGFELLVNWCTDCVAVEIRAVDLLAVCDLDTEKGFGSTAVSGEGDEHVAENLTHFGGAAIGEVDLVAVRVFHCHEAVEVCD